MQKYKVSFKGQNIYVGIDVHLKTWHVTTLTESGCKYSFSQHADAKELFDRRNGVRHLCAHGHTQTLSPRLHSKYGQSSLFGDLNKDGKVDVADHVKLSDIINK